MKLYHLAIYAFDGYFFGAINSVELGWTLGDIGVGIMAWLNFIAIFLLRKPALALLKDYERQKKEGIVEPVFNPDKSNFNLEGMDLWRRVAKRFKDSEAKKNEEKHL